MDPIPIKGAPLGGKGAPLGGPGPIEPARNRTAGAASDTPAFRALLESLEARALELKRRSEALAGPADLAGAVDSAREALADARGLQESLLEAYRQAQRQAPRHGAGGAP
jgi:hypothetical protein